MLRKKHIDRQVTFTEGKTDKNNQGGTFFTDLCHDNLLINQLSRDILTHSKKLFASDLCNGAKEGTPNKPGGKQNRKDSNQQVAAIELLESTRANRTE